MYKLTRIGIIVIILSVVVGCSSNPIKERKYSETTIEQVTESNELSQEELELLNSSISRAKTNNINIENNTIEEIILLEREYLVEEQERKRLEEEQRKAELKKKQEEEEKRKQEQITLLEETITVNTLSKDVIYEDLDKWIFSDYITFKLEYINNSTDREVRGFSGVITFKDIFGDEIKSLTLKYDESNIKPDEKVIFDGSMEVNQYMNEDLKLRDTDLEKLQIDFEMDSIIFADGTSIKRSDIK